MRALPVALASVLVAACGGEELSSPPGDRAASRAETFPVEVTLDDGTTYRGQHLTVSLLDGPDGFVQLGVDGMDEDGATGWSAIGVAPVEDLEDGALTFAMRKLPLADGVANVSRHYADKSWVGAESGALEVFLGHDGEADGVATATPSEVSASFRGPYGVSCWVDPAALGQEPNGTGEPGGQERIEDEAFASEFCQRFAAWR